MEIKTVKTRIKKDDNVVVVSGADRGKRGKVLFIDNKKGRVIVWTAMAILACSMVAGARDAIQAQVHDDLQPGSVLVFPKFDIEDNYVTKLAITNTHPSASVNVQIRALTSRAQNSKTIPGDHSTYVPVTRRGASIVCARSESAFLT